MSALVSKPTSKPRSVAVRRRLQAAPNDPPSKANLQPWTGAGWRNDKTTGNNTQGNENHTTFKNATGMGSQNQGSTTTTSAGNPDSLVTDKVDQKGQVQTSGQNLSDTNYTNLPPNLTPTSDWPNALSFTNKNNAQRAQLFLHGLLGSIPVLVNKSGENNEKFQATDQKWSYTELKSDQTKLNLPAYGEVNGLLNPALVENYFGTTRTSSTANQNSTTVPGIGFKIPEQNNDSKAVLITPGLAWTPQDVGNLVVSGTSFSFQLGGWLVSFTDFVKPRAGYLGLQLTGLDASDATQRALIWAPPALSGLSWQLGQPVGPRGECVGFEGSVGGSSSVRLARIYHHRNRGYLTGAPECFGLSGECGGSECLQAKHELRPNPIH